MCAHGACETSLLVSLEQLDKFVELDLLLLLAAAPDRFSDAMVGMVLEDFSLDLVEGGFDSPKLGQDVDAIPFILNHARDPAHLPLDPGQTGKAVFVTWFHGCARLLCRCQTSRLKPDV